MGTLYVVGTPIGNLEDITLRALRILKEVDVIACEDTRITKRLLERYEIATPMISYHQHSTVGKIDFLIEKLQSGKNIALVSDAGTPGIADPGGLLVRAVHEQGITVVAIPGPSALASEISISGMPSERFLFLAHKKGRETIMKQIADAEHPVIFYESVHRISKALEQLLSAGIDREIIVGRELTKQFETIYRGTPQEIISKLTAEQMKGEFVVLVSGKKK
jgi:16S rRNA (cytidine1402-2'-O)-methyltransferase